jgi:LysR family glycine cleavage system transcriptional activator
MPDVDVSHGLRFNSADRALEAASQNAGVVLTYDLLAYDDLRAGRLVIPIALALPAGRAWYFVCPRSGRDRPQVEAFRDGSKRRWQRSIGAQWSGRRRGTICLALHLIFQHVPRSQN